MSISLRNFKMKPKHSFSYLSRRTSIVHSSASKKRFSPAVFYLKYYLGIIFLLSGSGRKLTLGNIFGKQRLGRKPFLFEPWYEITIIDTLGH